MMGNDWYGMGGWMGGGWLWMVLLTIAFVLVIAWAVRGTAGSGGSQRSTSDRSDRPTALEALDMRFAKGEISEDEYKNMRRTLTGG
jgi:putative membrane protein